jgi:hypothetical protein
MASPATAAISTTESEAILQTEVERAQSREATATDRYWKLLAMLTHDDPTPDDLDNLVNAGRLKVAARQALWEALAKLDDFRRAELRVRAAR